MVSRPPTSQMRMNDPAPSRPFTATSAISAGARKIPLPIMVPTMMLTESMRRRRRVSAIRVLVGGQSAHGDGEQRRARVVEQRRAAQKEPRRGATNAPLAWPHAAPRVQPRAAPARLRRNAFPGDVLTAADDRVGGGEMPELVSQRKRRCQPQGEPMLLLAIRKQRPPGRHIAGGRMAGDRA